MRRFRTLFDGNRVAPDKAATPSGLSRQLLGGPFSTRRRKMETEEIWRPILGFEGRYEVSSFGRVQSFTRQTTDCIGRTRTYPATMLTPVRLTNGYMRVTLCAAAETIACAMVHRLVAKTFIPMVEGKNQVNHKDGVRDNNNVANLEWVSCSENHRHAIDVLKRKHVSPRGEDSPHSKLTREQVLAIRARRSENHRVLAREFGVTPSTIYHIWRRWVWSWLP